MKSFFKNLIAANMLVAMGLGAGTVSAQTSVEVFLTGGPLLSNYPGFVVTSSFDLTFSNISSVALPGGSFRIQASVPAGVEFATAAEYTPPAGWTYVRLSATSMKLTPNTAVSSDASLSTQFFSIPIRTLAPVGPNNNFVMIPQAEIQSAGTYTFPITPSNNISGPLTVANNPLPVLFQDFTATAEGCKVVLNWSTAVEKNNSHFVIERSSNSSDFTAIGRTNGAGTSFELNKYTYEDKAPLAHHNFYRIRQVDFDGSTTTSTVANAKVDCQNTGISIYPNPATSAVYVKGLTNKSTIEIYNVVGQKVVSKVAENTLEAVNMSGLAEGVYQVQVVSGGETIYSNKLIKK